MDNLVQKEYQFERIALAHSFDGPFPSFIVRQASPSRHKEREEKLLSLKRKYSTFISQGHYLLKESEFIQLVAEVQMIEIMLSLVDCNLTLSETGNRILHFENGRVSRGTLGLSPKEREQIHKKAVEINPSWQGEVERVAEFLREEISRASKEQQLVESEHSQEQEEAASPPSKEQQLVDSEKIQEQEEVASIPGKQQLAISEPIQEKNKGHFKDLAIQKSLFTKNKDYLQSLFEEIKQDVFDNEGEIRLDFPPGFFAEISIEYQNIIVRSAPYFENIVYLLGKMEVEKQSQSYTKLFTARSVYQILEDKDLSNWKYIGVVERGLSEVRVVAHKVDYSERGLFNYWDTTIEDIISTLRTAIQWYQRKEVKTPSRYTEEELDALSDMDEDTSWMQEAMDTAEELNEYLDDD